MGARFGTGALRSGSLLGMLASTMASAPEHALILRQISGSSTRACRTSDGAEMGPVASPTRTERIGPTRLGTAGPARGSGRSRQSQTGCRQGLGEGTLLVDVYEATCLTSHAREHVKVLLEQHRAHYVFWASLEA